MSVWKTGSWHPEEKRIEEGGSMMPLTYPFDVKNGEDCIFVGVGETRSSMDALSWTLKNINAHNNNNNNTPPPPTVLYLLHVLPEIRFIPSPLGMLPKAQVNPQLVEMYLAQEKHRTTQFLHNLVHMCSSSSKLTVKTLLLKDDLVAKAILDIIPILNIRKLVLGASSKKKMRWRGRSGIAYQITEHVPSSCEVRIISDGKQIVD